MFRVIGLVGRSRSGKDTVADYLIQNNSAYRKVRLAQPIKEAVCSLYGFTPDQVEGQDKENIDIRWGITPRQAMVHITHSLREFMGHDFFSKRLLDNLPNYPIIIPDVRYAEDIERIRSLGGLIIKIERPYSTKHTFEDIIDTLEGDYFIKNDGNLEEFYKQIDSCTMIKVLPKNDFIQA